MPNRLKKPSGLILLAAVSALLLLAPGAHAWEGGQPSWQTGQNAQAADSKNSHLDSLSNALVSFFTPMSGNVLSVNDGTLAVSIVNSPAPAMEGMRFSVFKPGAEFYHPVTGKPLWQTQVLTGTAQATKTISGKSGIQLELKMVKGQAAPGDVVRISTAKVRLLFYQLKNVSWGLSQQYYDILRKTGRFDLLSSPLDDEKDAMAEGKRLKADAVLILSQGTEGGNTALTQKLLWTSGPGQVVLVSGTVIGKKEQNYLTLGDKLFAPKNDTLIMFNVPFGAHMICLANVLGKGRQTLAISSSNDISFYNITSSLLAPALQGAEIKGKGTDQFLRVQAADVTGSGRDQIIVTERRDGDLFSSIYDYHGGAFRRLWEGPFFLRAIDGKLYAQKVSMGQGYKGSVRGVTLEGGRIVWGGKLALPKGVNIFDFSMMRYGGQTFTIAYDNRGFIKVYNKDGLAVWKSPGGFGGFPESFKKKSDSLVAEGGRWYIKDNIKVMGRDALLISRKPIISMVKGLGYKSSRIVVLRWNGTSMKELVLGAKIGGTIMDFAASHNRLMILASPLFGLNLAKILQGESPLTTHLYMYPLEGE